MKSYEEIASTALPKGYDSSALYLRRWLLDLRSRIKQLPLERQRQLDAKINEYYPNRYAADRTNRTTNLHLLARASAG